MNWYDFLFLGIALIIIILSLLQGGKSEGASGAITGGGLNVFVKTKERGSELVITWLTFIFAVIFLFLAILVYALQPDAPAESTEGAATAINYLVSLL
jgi:preprotein translocase subunit SecG